MTTEIVRLCVPFIPVLVYCPVGFGYEPGEPEGCTECRKGYYKDIDGNTNCVMCPGITTTAGVGSTNVSDCNLGNNFPSLVYCIFWDNHTRKHVSPDSLGTVSQFVTACPE